MLLCVFKAALVCCSVGLYMFLHSDDMAVNKHLLTKQLLVVPVVLTLYSSGQLLKVQGVYKTQSLSLSHTHSS